MLNDVFHVNCALIICLLQEYCGIFFPRKNINYKFMAFNMFSRVRCLSRIKTYISHLVRMTRFWNNLHQVLSKFKYKIMLSWAEIYQNRYKSGLYFSTHPRFGFVLYFNFISISHIMEVILLVDRSVELKTYKK